jgi:hypothetical protein
MSSRTQRKKERHEQKRKDKRKKQAQQRQRLGGASPHGSAPLGSNQRHQQRLKQQSPQAWPGESLEDAAVFDESAFASLPPELSAQVAAVREALAEAAASRGEEALKRVSAIPRSSSVSEWRLFVRGLVDWLAGKSEAASDAWKRLSPERRPGRIATAMMVALRSDVQEVAIGGSVTEAADDGSPNEWLGRCDEQLRYHAKLLRRVRFDRAALRVAEAGVKIPEESKELLLGPEKIKWLRQFIAEYGPTEPDLAAALSQVALGRAARQQYVDMFDEAVRAFEGPRHDRRNRLLAFFYYGRFENSSSAAAKSDQALRDYLLGLPENKSLSEPIRGAIASEIHLNEANARRTRDAGPFVFGPPENSREIRRHFDASIKAYPSNREAHKSYVEWIESKLDTDRLTKAQRKPLEVQLAAAMRNWSQGLANDIEPRLWLVDYLLENEEIEEARPHVDFLASSRHDDPRVRATPWKWQILEAMRLCRRKAWLAEVPLRLDEAEKLWPAWLSKQWLPYLRAALLMRSGQAEAYESERKQIAEASGLKRDSLPDACMMLAAAQQMRASAAELNRLRQAVEPSLKELDALPLDDLLAAGSFFWDLHRVQLLYPAYRMHGAKIGKALLGRLTKEARLVVDRLNDERMQKAVLWCSEYRFWMYDFSHELPSWFSKPAVQRHPMFAAARVQAFLKRRHLWGADKEHAHATILREAAGSQRDAYYRYWFGALADKLDDAISAARSSIQGRFSDLFGGGDLEADDADFDDKADLDETDLEDDDECDCAVCRAARRQAAAKSKRSGDNLPF